MKMNERLKKLVNQKFMALAQDLMNNPEGLKFKLQKVAEKLDKQSVKDALGVHIENLKTFVRMIRAWISRRYRKVSMQTILYAIVAVIYFLTPTDFVPDFILGLGFVDDIAVITWVLNYISGDLDKFRAWEETEKTQSETKKDENPSASDEESL